QPRGSELIIAPWTAMIQSAQLFGHYRHTSAAPSADPSPPFFLFFIAKSSHNPTQHNKKTSGRAGVLFTTVSLAERL
uniref:hypothetical protein n=1 Tax=Bifidobacterium adolescentis TaxID=1680 RepID=UPI00359C1AF5